MFWLVANLCMGALECFVTWLSVYRFMRVNGQTIFRKKPWYVVGFVLAGVIQFAAAFVFPGSWVTVGVPLILVAVLSVLLFHREVQSLGIDILFMVILILGMECGIFIMNLIGSWVKITGILQFGTLSMAIKIVIVVLSAYGMVKWRRNESEGVLPVRQSLVIMVLPAFSLFFMYSLLEMMQVYIQLEGVGLVLVNMIFLLLMNVYFLYLFGYLFRAKKLEEEMKIFQLQNEIQYRYYEKLEQKYKESRKVFHDMKNHLQAVEQLYEEKNKDAGDTYVGDLYHMLNVLGEKYYSSNHMINIILNEKLSAAGKAGIQVKAEVGDVAFDDLKDIDITTIFANLLDNAVEAAGKAGGGAVLDLKIDAVQDFRVIQIRNSKNIDSEGVDEESQSCKAGGADKKKNDRHMGLGLANVRYALEKYHGSLEQSMTDKEYRISVMIPGKE